MTDASRDFVDYSEADLADQKARSDVLANRHTEATLERFKTEGLDLAVQTRWVALAIVALMLPYLNPRIEVLYYEALVLALALNGWVARKVGRVGQSRLELVVLFVDLALMTFVLVFPNPFMVNDWPEALVYRFSNFQYMYVLLAGGTLSFSWRTILAMGTWTTGFWITGLALMWWFVVPDAELTAAAMAAYPNDPLLAEFLDPNSLLIELRVQEVVIFLIVAATLALMVRRFNNLLLSNAGLERERENLSRYFSPNVVGELSQNDEPLKQIRTHDVAVLFVDIVGFTAYAAHRPPEEVIETLRGFHARMETEVFANGGTLDKYLGDGLMATFGTPMAGDRDATNALRCARAMALSLAEWNAERERLGELQIKGSFGLHYGPVVLGDIGANRLEFAVIGTTVNVANRIERLTRNLECEIAVTDHLRAQVIAENAVSDIAITGLACQDPQPIRGLDTPVIVWTL